jgi:hypothetical protein
MSIKYANNNSLSAIDTKPSGLSGGAMTLLSTETASSSDTISFTSGIDDTYKEYIIKFINIHPATDGEDLQVNFRDGSSAYDATKTTTTFRAYHDEADSDTALGYDTGSDLAQSTGIQKLINSVGADNDQCVSGILKLFDPSSTTFVKHFIVETQALQSNDTSKIQFTAGYCNTTTAIDGVQFSMSSGAIASGTFKLYGVS